MIGKWRKGGLGDRSDSGEAAGNKKLPDRPGCCRKERRDRSKKNYPTEEILEEDRIEIVSFVGGG